MLFTDIIGIPSCINLCHHSEKVKQFLKLNFFIVFQVFLLFTSLLNWKHIAVYLGKKRSYIRRCCGKKRKSQVIYLHFFLRQNKSLNRVLPFFFFFSFVSSTMGDFHAWNKCLLSHFYCKSIRFRLFFVLI